MSDLELISANSSVREAFLSDISAVICSLRNDHGCQPHPTLNFLMPTVQSHGSCE